MVNIRKLSPLLAKKAKEELNEDSNRVEECITILREWISKQPHLKTRMDDQFLLIFLRWSKFSVERAKQKLESFYELKIVIPEIYQDRVKKMENLEDLFRAGVVLKLPKPFEEDGPSISMLRIGQYNPEKYNLKNALTVQSYLGDIQLIENDNLTVSGYIQITDLANITAAHLFQIDPSFLKRIAFAFEIGLSVRNKGVHIINAPPGSQTLFNLFKSFISEKNKSKFFVHGSDLTSLYEHIPRRYLPAEYGGENGSIPEILSQWKEKIESYHNYFLEDVNYGIDVKLRKGPSHLDEYIYGSDGTFRQLDID